MSALGDQGRLQGGENPQETDSRDNTNPIVTVKARHFLAEHAVCQGPANCERLWTGLNC